MVASKARALIHLSVIACLVPIPKSVAGDELEFRNKTAQPANNRHRFSISYRSLGQSSVELRGLGRYTSPNSGTLTLGTTEQDRVYDDGYKRVDSSGNEGSRTWNWGYADDSQVSPLTDSIALSIYETSGTERLKDEPSAPGFLFSYGQVIGELPFSFTNSATPSLWGAEFHVGYNRLESEHRFSFQGDISRTSDSYALNGVVPPSAPYAGTFDGPGPILSDVAMRSIDLLENASSVRGSWEADLDLYTLGAGPFFEIPLHEQLTLTLGFGIQAGVVRSSFRADEIVTVRGGAANSRSIHDSDSDLLFGAYASAALQVNLEDNVYLFAAIRWETLDSFSHREGGLTIDYDFDHLVSGGFGVGVRF